MTLVYAASGHRPDRLGGYGPIPRAALKKLARGFLVSNRPDKVISGMALGWDQGWAEAALELGIPLIAALPFPGQCEKWPAHTQKLYRDMIAQAAEVVLVSQVYGPEVMQRRNEWMVDRSDQVIALWDGVQSGGTYNCIKYAQDVARKPVWNLFPRYQAGVF